MRRIWVTTIVVAVLGLVFGALFRYLHDPVDETNVANYLRSSLHGAGLTLSGWATHLYFISRSSAWVRRWPLVVELIVRSLAMAVVVAVEPQEVVLCQTESADRRLKIYAAMRPVPIVFV